MTTQSWHPTEATIPDLGVSYLAAGGGDPVLLLHGWAAFKEIWWGTLRALEPRYHAIALEWPGHGRSPAAAGMDLLTDLADLAARSSAALGFDRITVVGHSMGGRVAALLALRHPQLVARLVLVDAALDPAHLAPYARRMLQLREVERSVAMSQRLGRGFGRWLKPATHDHVGGFVRPYLRRAYYNGLADPNTLHSYITALYADSLDAHLGEITQPTLVVSGERDPLVLPRQARRAAAAIPNARLALIKGALHNPMDDRPAEFQRVLVNFLDTVPPVDSASHA